MGVNKKFLILSLLIVGSNLVYSANELGNYDGKVQLVNGGKEYENNVEQTINGGKWLHITDGKVTNNETGKIVVTGSGPVAQFAGEKAEFLNKGNIEVQNGKGFYITDGNLKNLGDITVTKGTGIQIQNGAAAKEKLTNQKNIMISGTSTGIIQASGKVVNNGKITSKNDLEEKPFLTSGTGLKIEGGEFINNNEIILEKNHTEAKGNAIFQSGGTLTNKGTITVSTNISIDSKKEPSDNKAKGGYGMNQAGGTIDNLGTLNIKATGESSIGMNQAGTLNNLIVDGKNGEIVIEASGKNSIGIKSTGTIKNDGIIKVNASGTNGVGIQLNADNATLISTGTIIVEAGTGVKVSKGIFINEKEGNLTATKGNAIFQNGGKSTNKGTINVSGKGNGINITNGTANNEGTIKVNASGIGVKISSKGTFTNSAKNITNEKGEIIEQQGLIVQGGTGILQTGGTVTNSGNINISQGAIGLDLQGGKFTNESSGIIENAGTIKISTKSEKAIGLEQKGKVTNKGTIILDVQETGAVGIKNTSGTFINEENSTIDIINGKGFFVEGGEVTNNGTINVDIKATTGLQLQGETAKFTNNNLIDVKKGTGVIVSGKTKNKEGEIVSTFVNSTNGKITVAAGQKGLQITKGKAENQGTINALKEKATGVYLGAITIEKVEDKKNPPTTKPSKYDSPGSFENNGTINVLGKEAKGIHIGAGVVNNIAEKGKIEAKDGAIGVYMQSLKAYVFNEKENSFE